MDVFDSISETCLDPELREERGGQAAEVSIEIAQGGDRTMGSDNATIITNSNGLIDAKGFFLRNDGETWNKWTVHMGAAKNIHDIKDNRRSSLGRKDDRDGNFCK